ncbi:E3 ubiquitin-protein ligase WAV3-like [Phragmites australis]|uniref:E3 ubiquitin-protein ligase WAV3-like n=1 Tax=Phragmites australis TaxID=29695 RepID=UPI002D78855D|nr:E3 ubiquitin-protein ligase WAV3-like [Phragmites australis]
MESRWRKAKMSLGLNLCVYVPRTLEGDDASSPNTGSSTAALVSPVASSSSAATSAETTPTAALAEQSNGKVKGGAGALMPTTPTPTSAGLRLSKSGSKSFKKTCAICLTTMKPGQGHALFTAECSHTFHFHCISANVKHGSSSCPVCRIKWKELPFRGPLPAKLPLGNASPVNGHQNGGQMTILRPLPRARSSGRLHHLTTLLPDTDPSTFNDDEPLDLLCEATEDPQQGCLRTVEIKTYPEFTEVPENMSERSFTVLIHLKAPLAQHLQTPSNLGDGNGPNTNRAPVDLITVLDVSGSMAGTKLALLKRAMGFVIQNLGSSDRLSVIAFSSSARRLFPLRRMTESGRQQSLLAVNSLTSNGGTNIAEGLRKGSKVIEDRQAKNPVCSIILLSDGQDTYNVSPTAGVHKAAALEYCALLPSTNGNQQVPVHVFGFGADHDSVSLHSISQASGGTFSFIETEAAIQDAFAQCIGGLLSVVAQGLHLKVESLHPDVHFGSIRSGSYSSSIADDKRNGSIDVGDLYAEEERDFLVSVNVPPGHGETALLKVGCVYKDPLMKEAVNMADVQVNISRPAFVSVQSVSIEVDRQKNRLHAAEVMAEARFSAERGDLTNAVSLLEDCRRMIMGSASGQSGDRLCQALDAELKEMQDRMANRQRYEASGRAYVLSGLSSHSWQRATARGDSTDSESLIQAYQTSSMVDMLLRSQTMSRSSTPRQTPQMRHAKSFPARPQPR